MGDVKDKAPVLPADRLRQKLSEVQLAQLPIYRDPMEHIRDELRRLAMLIELRRMLSRRGPEEKNRFQGLLLRDGEFGELVNKAAGVHQNQKDPDLARKQGEFEAMSRRLALREAATIWSVEKEAGGVPLPLLEVARRFGLDRFQYQVLVLGLAPEVELAFQKMFSHLHNDVTRRRPSVHLALELFGGDDTARREGRRSFAPDSPLLRYNLIHMEGAGNGLEKSLLLRDFKMPERMVQWLMGTCELSAEMHSYAQIIEGPATTDDLIYNDTLSRRLGALRAYLGERPDGEGPTPLVVLTGKDGVGKRSVSARLAAHETGGRRLLVVNLAATAIPVSRRDKAFRDMAREAALHDTALCMANYSDRLVQGGISPSLPYLFQIARMAPGLGVITACEEEIGLGGAGAGFSTRLHLEIPDTYGRIALWELMLAKTGTRVEEGLDLKGFSLKYGFTAGTIQRVLAYASEEAAVRTTERGAPINDGDLDLACRIQLGQGLSGVATRVRRTASWDDVILPEELVETLQEILRHARMRTQVFHDWGFDRKMTSGKGLSVLFSGPPGTGKTMVAGVLASELGMDLYKVDLSQIVSKYVGETEKNLNKVFEAAAANQFIILFDEADSLFSKRTEVKSSVDRYANLEVNYLLQKMEEYSGICVLTTNFEKSIDDAFKRRINFRLDFPFPEPEDRARLWQVHLPIEAPVDPELELEWLAEKYELSGGNIKNAVLRAAFRAAEGARAINIEDLEYAADRESRELGKLVQGAL